MGPFASPPGQWATSIARPIWRKSKPRLPRQTFSSRSFKERSAIENDFGVEALYSPADMSKPSEIAEMIALAQKTFGGVDVLVNNAGVQHVSAIEDFPLDRWDAIIAINLSAAFHAIR